MDDPLNAFAEAQFAQAKAFSNYVRERDERVNAELSALRRDMNAVLQAIQNVGGQLEQLNRAR